MGLKVGLTGGLGSGKSTVARMFAERGVHTISADEIGRELMRPGTSVYDLIVGQFGDEVLRPDRTLDRKALARLAFDEHRLAELNRIVHPATIAAQNEWTQRIFAKEPEAITMVESALVFEVARESNGRSALKLRFDKIILVTVPNEQKVARYMARVSPDRWDEALAADARRRIAAQIPDNEKIAGSDYVIENTGTIEETASRVKAIYHDLRRISSLTSRLANPSEWDEQTR
jgi:dephospho-CoA kinase